MELRACAGALRRVVLSGLWSCAALASPTAPDPADPLPTAPAWFFYSNKSGTAFGGAVAFGDVNGDGFDDLLIGAPTYDTSSAADAGAIFLYRGSATGPGFTASWSFQGTASGNRLGSSVAGAGDVNGDGYDDLLVGEPRYTQGQSGEGRAQLFLGSASGAPVTPAAWSVQADQAGAELGTVVAGAGDVNGDGYADVLVTAPFYNASHSDDGIVRIYHGSASGLSALPALTIEGEDDGIVLGTSAAGVGDVNGDGFDDVAIGTLQDQTPYSFAGRVSLYLGSPTGLSPIAAWSFHGESVGATLGRSVSGARDVNGDGYADVIVGADYSDNGHGTLGSPLREGKAYLFLGNPAGLPASPSWTAEGIQDQERFGFSVAGLGDVDGDGYGDFAVGSIAFNDPDIAGTGEGRVTLYLGSATMPATSNPWSVTGRKSGEAFGAAVAGAGDPDGDGLGNLLVGSPGFSDLQNGEGAVSLFFGPDVPNPCVDLDGDGYGNPGRVACRGGAAGDCNDGSPTTWPGAPELCNSVDDNCNSQIDEAYQLGLSCFVGVGMCARTGRTVCAAGGTTTTCGMSAPGMPQPEVCDGLDNDCDAQVDEGLPDPAACRIAASTKQSDRLGSAVASAGDVNGDGFDDVVAGAPGTSGFGAVSLFPGTATGIANGPSWVALAPNVVGGGQAFGSSVAGVGDVDGDGFADILVGAPQYDAEHIGFPRGAAYLYRGSSTTPLMAGGGPGPAIRERFGSSVAGAGDLNGDGRPEVVITAPGFTQPTPPYFARAYVYRWDGSLVLQQTILAAATHLVPAGVARLGDINGDAFGDLLIGWVSIDNGQPGRASLYLGGPAGPATTPAWSAPAPAGEPSFGASVAAAGDVNGDGRTDVLIGAPGSTGPSGTGRAYLYLGIPSGLSASPGWTTVSTDPGDLFGGRVAAAGDIDSDGYADVLVSASRFDENHVDEGRTFLFRGGPAGPATAPAWQSAAADQPGAVSGSSVAATRRLNGSGISEIVIGSPGFDSGGAPAAGRVDFLTVCLDTAADGDGDGIGDACDCAPGVPGVSAPPPVVFLQASHGASGAETWVSWTQPAGTTHSNTYRGSIPAGGMGTRLDPYDHACFESADSFGDGAALTTDPAAPQVGRGFYYLVSAENGCGEGDLGIPWSGAGPTPPACPTPP